MAKIDPTVVARAQVTIYVLPGEKLNCICGQPLGYALRGEYITKCPSCKVKVTFISQ